MLWAGPQGPSPLLGPTFSLPCGPLMLTEFAQQPSWTPASLPRPFLWLRA